MGHINDTKMLERNFKKKVQDDLKKQGWVFIQLVAQSGVPMGFPDTLCLSPTGYHCFVEWKKDKNAEHQPLQGYWINKLNNTGHDAQFVHTQNVEEWRDYVVRISRELSRTTR